jgi:hypothetical protein
LIRKSAALMLGRRWLGAGIRFGDEANNNRMFARKRRLVEGGEGEEA